MKVIRINTPDGQYTLPLIKAVENLANYFYEKGSKEHKEQVEFAMGDDFEGIDWILNNTNYEDWENDTTKINSDVKVTDEDFWTSSEDFEIIDVPQNE